MKTETYGHRNEEVADWKRKTYIFFKSSFSNKEIHIMAFCSYHINCMVFVFFLISTEKIVISLSFVPSDHSGPFSQFEMNLFYFNLFLWFFSTFLQPSTEPDFWERREKKLQTLIWLAWRNHPDAAIKCKINYCCVEMNP